jgi:nitroreductase
MGLVDKGQLIDNNRKPEASVDPMFLNRWSPRAFSLEPIPDETLRSLFEAARWTPSCYNEQPWLFLYSGTEEERLEFLSILMDGNQVWAKNVPVFAFAFARRTFKKNSKPNRWAAFDTGAAWMSLTIQARLLGLYTHGMAGYHRKKAYEVLGVPENDYEVICAIAIGKHGDPAFLPEDILAQEQPNDRKPLAEVAIAGRWPGNRG